VAIDVGDPVRSNISGGHGQKPGRTNVPGTRHEDDAVAITNAKAASNLSAADFFAAKPSNRIRCTATGR
jgi:hypothetical protein